jgi:hypothetical protein
MPQFVDLCILCGCDYTDTIRGIGPKNALKLIKTHGTIEKVLESLDTTKYPLPESFDYAQVWVSSGCSRLASRTHSSRHNTRTHTQGTPQPLALPPSSRWLWVGGGVVATLRYPPVGPPAPCVCSARTSSPSVFVCE